MKLTPEQERHLVGLERKGRLTPDTVIAEAADSNSPLHPLFEWDDAAAAREHRLDQARTIIREVIVTVKTTSRLVQVERYVPDPDRGRDQGYVGLDSVKDEDTQRRIVIAEATRALGLMRRAVVIAAALGLESGAMDVVNAWISWRDDVEGHPPVSLAAD